MKELDRIKDQLIKTFEGGAWHGPSISEVLQGIGYKEAVSKPLNNIHTILEIVLHIKAWVDITRIRLQGNIFNASLTDDWPDVNISNEESWLQTIENLKESITRLADSIIKFEESKLDENAAGQDYSNYFMLYGVIQHNVYHAGQIALLKKTFE